VQNNVSNGIIKKQLLHEVAFFLFSSIFLFLNSLGCANNSYFCNVVHTRIEIVIKKGRGIRPAEALATLYPIKKVLNSTKSCGVTSDR
jgi:hypothetical protein